MWRRSSFCNGASACVEVREPSEETGGMWQVRDAKDPDGPFLRFTEAEWEAFLAGVRNGEFDLDAIDAPTSVTPRRPLGAPLTQEVAS